MVLRQTKISYSFKNIGNVSHNFYVWVYLYDEQNWDWKFDFKKSSVSLDVGKTWSESITKSVDLVLGHTYRAVAAIYSDSSYLNKLDDGNSNTITVVSSVIAQNAFAQSEWQNRPVFSGDPAIQRIEVMFDAVLDKISCYANPDNFGVGEQPFFRLLDVKTGQNLIGFSWALWTNTGGNFGEWLQRFSDSVLSQNIQLKKGQLLDVIITGKPKENTNNPYFWRAAQSKINNSFFVRVFGII